MSTLSLPCRVAHRAASLTRLRMSAPVRPTVPPASRLEIDIVRQRHVAHVDLENCQAPLVIRPIHRDVAIESARAQQGRIEHVGPIRGGQHDDRLGRAEAVHLAEDLVESLLAFIVAAAEAGAANAADGVDFIDEQNRRRGILGRFEHVADAARADAHEHLNEFGAADRKERHARFAGHRAGQQRFAGARRAHQQHALGNAAAQAWNFSGFLRNSTISCRSCFTPSRPATSVNVIGLLAGLVTLGGTLAETREDSAAHELVAGPAKHHPNANE